MAGHLTSISTIFQPYKGDGSVIMMCNEAQFKIGVPQKVYLVMPGIWHQHFVFELVKECLTLKLLESKITEFANSVDLDEVAHNGPPHLHLHCLPFSL